ncbi:MAG TPA: hypothetical protein VH440_01050 [Candidatus Limnocylindrales bacterium]|jgi:hypothetical protein
MTATLQRIARPVAIAIVLILLAVGLLEAGIAIGANAARPAAPLAATNVTTTTTGAVPAAAAGAPADDPIVAQVDAILAADQTTASGAAPGKVNRAVAGLRRLAAARKLVHATVVVNLPKLGGLTTVQLDHGTISAIGATSLSVAETGGTTATVSLGDETRVRKNAAKAAVADLKSGDEVFVMSKVTGGKAEAYLVVVPKR